jgi:hypothetical protein
MEVFMKALEHVASCLPMTQKDLTSALHAAVDTYARGENNFNEMIYLILEINKIYSFTKIEE